MAEIIEKCYPIIEEDLLAFYTTDLVNNTALLKINYQENPLITNVSDDYDGIILYFCSGIGNVLKTYFANKTNLNKENKTAWFTIDTKDIYLGQIYKIQLAYQHKDKTGMSSGFSVIKYTGKPELSLQYNYYKNELIFNYLNEDITENILTLQVSILENTGTLVEKIDTINTKSNIISIKHKISLKNTFEYIADVKYTTTNGLTINASFNFITPPIVYSKNIRHLYLEIDYEKEMGRNKISLIKNSEENINWKMLAGNYIISKASKKYNKEDWVQIASFSIPRDSDDNFSFSFYDNILENGNNYYYSIQQSNKYGLTSQRVSNHMLDINGKDISDTGVEVFFEHMFLLDKDKSLCIKFNPKVSSFKNDILETKLETIGNKYPYIFRNNNVQYKEFSINGLISYYMDILDSFNTKDQDLFTTNLTDINIYNEQRFKVEVLAWLNNGKPKLFKSPQEGNYLVYLMNVSLSPEDALGRMLHSFSATAYEIQEYNYDNLLSFDTVSINQKIIKEYEKIDLFHYWNKDLSDLDHEVTEEEIQKDFTIKSKDENFVISAEDGYYFLNLRIFDMAVGDEVTIGYIDGKKDIYIAKKDNLFYIDNENKIKSITFSKNNSSFGIIEYEKIFDQHYLNTDFKENISLINTTLEAETIEVNDDMSKQSVQQILDWGKNYYKYINGDEIKGFPYTLLKFKYIKIKSENNITIKISYLDNSYIIETIGGNDSLYFKYNQDNDDNLIYISNIDAKDSYSFEYVGYKILLTSSK